MDGFVRGNQRVKGNSTVEGILKTDSIAENTSANGVSIDSVTLKDGAVLSGASLGTADTGVTATHYGDGKDITTVLTFTSLSYTISGAANEAIGKLVFTFPAGAHVHNYTYMDVALQGGGTVDADTPDIGIGSVIATGSVAVLGGTAGFEDYITGQTASNCNGTATKKTSVATAGALTGISINEAAGVKAVHLNIADGWAGADTVTASGTIVLKWTKML